MDGESNHATSFTVQFVQRACSFCSVPSGYLHLQSDIHCGVLACSLYHGTGLLHAHDRKDWTIVPDNLKAYFLPLLPRKRSSRRVCLEHLGMEGGREGGMDRPHIFWHVNLALHVAHAFLFSVFETLSVHRIRSV